MATASFYGILSTRLLNDNSSYLLLSVINVTKIHQMYHIKTNSVSYYEISTLIQE